VHWSERTQRLLFVAIVLPWTAGRAAGEDLTVTVNAQANALFGQPYLNDVALELPPGTTSFLVSAIGTAYCAPGRPFAGVILGQHTSPAFEFVTVQVSTPPVEIAHAQGDERVSLWFAGGRGGRDPGTHTRPWSSCTTSR
jgi:hypothetical protein